MESRNTELATEVTPGQPPESTPAPNNLAIANAIRPAHLPQRARTEHLPSINLHGVQVHRITERQALETIVNELNEGRGGTVVTPNLDHIYRAARDVSFSALVTESDLVVADGMPLVWASKLQGTPLPERVAGSNMISSLSGACADKGKSVYLLGGAPGTAEAASKVLVDRFPLLKIVGTHCPPMGFENDQKQMLDLVSRLTSANPDVVFVALGSPKQEYLIARLRLTLPRSWWLGVGVSFSFLCGDVQRAPVWMQKSGLEWVHRLTQEPKRLFKRYVMTGIPFAGHMLLRASYRGIKQRTGVRNYASAGTHARRINDDGESNGNGRSNGNGQHDPSDDSGAFEVSNGNGHVIVATERQPAPRIPARDYSALPRLKGLILLGGSVRPSPLGSALGQSVLDLPIDENNTILSHWLQHAQQVAQQAQIATLPVRVLVDRNSVEPTSGNQHFGAFRVERDQSEYRGTGGVLHDLSADYADDDFILVANAAQILLDPLAAIARTLDQKKADVGLVSHRDGTPSGIMLLHVKVLRAIQKVGFIDLKEQAMPKIAKEHDVAVLHRRRPTGLAVRTRQDYIMALRYAHSLRLNKATLNDPLAEDWKPSFSIADTGAKVDASARLHDSVAMAGAVVEPGAVLVRSVVCRGATVRRDQTVVDQVICAPKLVTK